MDISRAFKAAFDDPQWVTKLLLVFVFEILVVTAPAVIGFWMQYVRNVAEGQDGRLPAWGDFGSYWVRGLLVILAGIVYVVVGLILFLIGVIPAVILFQAAIVEYAMTERAGSLFALKTIWHRITTVMTFWTAWAIALGLGVALNIVSRVFSAAGSNAASALGGLIVAVLGVYVAAVDFDLYGQYARQAYAVAPGAYPPQSYAPSGYPPAGTPSYGPPPPPVPRPQGFVPPPPPPPPAADLEPPPRPPASPQDG